MLAVILCASFTLMTSFASDWKKVQASGTFFSVASEWNTNMWSYYATTDTGHA